MKKPGLKDLRTALRVLENLDIEVSQDIYVAISDRIRETESQRQSRRMERMTEEELEQFDNRSLTRLRVTTPEGRIIQERRNEDTFLMVLSQIDASLLASVSIEVHRHPLIKVDAKRKRITGYKLMADGMFVYRRCNVHEMQTALKQIDRMLSLGWDIEVR